MTWANKRTNTPADQARRREYDSPAYRAARKALIAEWAAGNGWCWRCGRYIPPSMPRHTGHDDHDRRIIRGNECPPCNLRKAASKGALVANARRKARRAGVTALRW